MSQSHKKIFSLILTSVLLTAIFSSLFPIRSTSAAIPVPGVGNVPIYIMGSSPVQLAQKTIQEKALAFLMATLLETLRKQLLDSFVDSIIKWIQGVDEKPMFVTNWRKFLSDVAGEAVGEYIETTKLAFLCQPFNFQVRVSLPQPGRPPLPTCTLNQIVGNIEDFYQDFRNGGWIAYNEMLYPWNNPYGAYLMALEGQAYEVAAALAEKEKETEQSQGFLNTKRCKAGKETTDSATGEKKCLEWELTTPGGLIAGQVQRVLEVDIDYILSAKDFEGYTAAILDALINRLFKAGVNGLLGILTSKAQSNLGNEAPSGLNYKCDEDVGTCALDPSGTYTDQATCQADCKQVTFSCNTETGTCFEDADGPYSTRADCRADCEKE